MHISKSKTRPRFLLVLALAYMIAGGWLPSGLAFCFGDDGHIALEALGSKGDCALGQESIYFTADPVKNYSHCGICFDIVSSSNNAIIVLKLSLSPLSGFAVPFLSVGRFLWCPALKVSFLNLSLPFTSHLAAIRTTVLLI